ncbi:MAG: hypothetical protein PHD83_05000 [Caldisericia bacterium]|nr:hypothetical protein [Caldisericia bacterium]
MKKTYRIALIVVTLMLSLTSCSLFTAKVKKAASLIEQQAKVTQAFTEQIQAYFAESPDKQEKIDAFEASINELVKGYYEEYKAKGEAGLEQARKELSDFFTNFKVEGVGISDDTVKEYLERFEKLVKPTP